MAAISEDPVLRMKTRASGRAAARKVERAKTTDTRVRGARTAPPGGDRAARDLPDYRGTTGTPRKTKGPVGANRLTLVFYGRGGGIRTRYPLHPINP